MTKAKKAAHMVALLYAGAPRCYGTGIKPIIVKQWGRVTCKNCLRLK